MRKVEVACKYFQCISQCSSSSASWKHQGTQWGGEGEKEWMNPFLAKWKLTYSVSRIRKAIQTDNSRETIDSGTSRKKQHKRPVPRLSMALSFWPCPHGCSENI